MKSWGRELPAEETRAEVPRQERLLLAVKHITTLVAAREGERMSTVPTGRAGHPGTRAVLSGLDFTPRAVGSHCRS